MAGAIRYHLTHLASFDGRESRAQFWPYTGIVIGLAMVGIAAPILLQISRLMAKAGPMMEVRPSPGLPPGSGAVAGQFSFAGSLSQIVTVVGIVSAVAVLLLAAAVVRRLHDRNMAGLWGALPLPFLIAALALMPGLFTRNELDLSLFTVLTACSLLYNAALIALIFLLAGGGTPGPNRYGGEAED